MTTAENVLDFTGAAAKVPARGQVPLVMRIIFGILRRANSWYWRCRYPRISFGRGSDVRSGFWAVVGSEGSVRFGPRCVLDRGLTIESHGHLIVGARTIFGHHCTIAVRDSIEIGQDCLFAEMVAIRDHDHRFDRLDVPIREQGMTVAPIRIGNNVWLASKVTVTSGVTIGDNAIVGANAVVTRDIPANAIAVGVPARVIKMRS